MELLKELITRYPELENCIVEIEKARKLLIDTYERGGKVLVCGNGGSAADSEHIVGELMKGFLLKRPVTDENILRNCAAVCREAFRQFPFPASVRSFLHLSMMWIRK